MDGSFLANRSFWGVFFVVLVAIMIAAVVPVWWQNQQLLQRIEILERETQQLQRQNTHYRKIIEALEKDPMYVEFLLRQKLHYGRKGEKVFHK